MAEPGPAEEIPDGLGNAGNPAGIGVIEIAGKLRPLGEGSSIGLVIEGTPKTMVGKLAGGTLPPGLLGEGRPLPFDSVGRMFGIGVGNTVGRRAEITVGSTLGGTLEMAEITVGRRLRRILELGRMLGKPFDIEGAVGTLVGSTVLPLTLPSNETRVWTTLEGRLAGRVRGANVGVGRPSRGIATTKLVLAASRSVVTRIFIRSNRTHSKEELDLLYRIKRSPELLYVFRGFFDSSLVHT